MTDPIAVDKRFSIIPLEDSGTSIAVAYNFRGTLLVGATVAAALLTAAPAHADDQSYLNYLEAHGQSTTAYPYSPGKFVMVGQMICTNLRSGADPLAGASPIDRATWGPIGVEAAQRELCPDTLH